MATKPATLAARATAMVLLAALLAPAWADGPAGSGKPARPSVTRVESLARTVGPGETMGCEAVILHEADVRTFFATAAEVTPATLDAEAAILPCSYSGRLESRGRLYDWNINAAGAGYLNSQDGREQRRFLCRKQCQKALPKLAGM